MGRRVWAPTHALEANRFMHGAALGEWLYHIKRRTFAKLLKMTCNHPLSRLVYHHCAVTMTGHDEETLTNALRETSTGLYCIAFLCMMVFVVVCAFNQKDSTGLPWYYALLKSTPCFILMCNAMMRVRSGKHRASPAYFQTCLGWSFLFHGIGDALLATVLSSANAAT